MSVRRLATSAALAAALVLLAGGTPAGAALAPATYRVQAGETLGGIAAAYGLADWRPLWAANRATVADPDLIFPGQVLTIPGGAGESAPPATAGNPAGPAAGKGDGDPGGVVGIIYAAADRYGQSRADMLRVARCESRLDATAVGRAGEIGLFQWLPSTWRGTPYAGYSPYDPWANANAAAWAWANGYRWWWTCR